MKIKQLSLFLENKPGQLTMACKLLGDAGINIVTMSLADTQQFGILRLVVKDWEKAKAVLEEAQCVVNVTEVAALAAPSRPGGLAEVLHVIDQENINVEYMYAFPEMFEGDAVLVFRFEDVDAAIAALEKHDVKILSADQIL